MEKLHGNCKFMAVNFKEKPCCECKGLSKWEPEEVSQTETKEPDYNFDQGIFDALRAGKSVWAQNDYIRELWFEVNDSMLINYNMTMIYEYKWSLEKPKVKVKKYQWILKGKENKFFMSDAHYKNSEEANKKMNGYYEAMEPYLPSEIEIEK
jgi:hypothetical protein